MNWTPELSVVMACFNEEATLPAAVERLNAVAGGSSLNLELIVLDEESHDGTLQVAAGLIPRYPLLHIRVFHRVRRRVGFGAIARYGIAHARGTYCAFVSADGSDPVELLPDMVRRLRGGAQHVQCSRYIRPEDERAVPRKYRFYQAVYRRLARWTLGEEIRDSTYGFRAFDRIYVQSLGLTSNRFSICPEITFKVFLSGGKLEHVAGHPVPFRGGSSKFELPHEIFGYGWVLFRASIHRFGLYWF